MHSFDAGFVLRARFIETPSGRYVEALRKVSLVLMDMAQCSAFSLLVGLFARNWVIVQWWLIKQGESVIRRLQQAIERIVRRSMDTKNEEPPGIVGIRHPIQAFNCKIEPRVSG